MAASILKSIDASSAASSFGHEPKYQRFGVNFLFVCLLVIVVGAFAGQWFAVMQKMGLKYNFWFGHQGWEYTDIGRFWQAFLFIGLMLWLVLVGRSLWPAMRRKDDMASIVGLLFLSTVSIGLFYGAGLMWGEKTHIAMVEYWRWWVVHLWVEGFFEVFAVAVISFLFVRLGLVRAKSATINVLFATIVFMAGGVLGTFHHLYWSGTPTAVLALGASFSALEVVPLALIGIEAYGTYKNGHTALFGVYGMLGIGLMMFCLRGMRPDAVWSDSTLRGAFWSLNIGLALMGLLTLLPLGLMQLNAVLENGYWFARSAEFMSQPLVHLLVWMRVPGDIIFATGGLLICWFVFSLWLPKRSK